MIFSPKNIKEENILELQTEKAIIKTALKNENKINKKRFKYLNL